LRVLDHEFSQFFTVASALGLLLLGAWAARRVPDDGRDPNSRMNLALLVTLTSGAVAGLAVFVAMDVANALGPNCQFENGVAFFWVTWVPLSLLGAVCGAILGNRGRGPGLAALLFLVVALLSLGQDLLQMLWGPHVVDFLVGEPLALDQRGTMALSRVHVLQRIFVCLIAAFAWMAAQGANSRRQADPQARGRLAGLAAIPMGALLVGLALLGGTRIGLGWSWSEVRTHLSGERRSEHFVIRYAPSGFSAPMVDGVAREAEWDWHDISTRWGVSPEKPVWIYLFESADDQRDLTGLEAPHAGMRAIVMPWWSIHEGTLRHELAHALNDELHPSVRVALYRGLLEGLAEAWSSDYVAVPEAHVRLSAALKAGKLPHADELISVLGFYEINESNAYDAAGSFIGWLILSRGWERFHTFERTLDFQEAYGMPVSGLDAEWRAFLAALPVDVDTVAETRDTFDPELSPGYLSQSCPKLGPRVPEPWREAEIRRNSGDWDGALALYEDLYASEGKPRQATAAIGCLRALGRCDEGLELGDRALALPDLDDGQRVSLLGQELRCLLQTRDWSGIDEVYSALDGMERKPSTDRAVLRQALSEPDARDVVATALASDDATTRRAALQELADARPDDTAARYVFLTRAQILPDLRRNAALRADQREAVVALLEQLPSVPGATDRLATRLVGIADRALRAGDLELAARIAETISYTAMEPLNRYRASARLERVTWVRGY
jgi:hypothetical protein